MSNDNNTRILNKLDKLDEKFDIKMEVMDQRIGNLDKHLAVYNVELQKHIEGVELAREENKLLKEYIEIKVKPIETYLDSKKTIKKFLFNLLTVGSVIVGIIAALYEIYFSN